MNIGESGDEGNAFFYGLHIFETRRMPKGGPPPAGGCAEVDDTMASLNLTNNFSMTPLSSTKQFPAGCDGRDGHGHGTRVAQPEICGDKDWFEKAPLRQSVIDHMEKEHASWWRVERRVVPRPPPPTIRWHG